MRIIYEVFDDGSHTVYETDDDGNQRQHIGGDPPPDPPRVRRMQTYIEVSCDDRDDAIQRTLKALEDVKQKYLRTRTAPGTSA